MKKKRGNPRFLSMQEAASDLHACGFSMTASEIREELKAGRLRAQNIRRRDYIARKDLNAWAFQKGEAPGE